MLGNVKDICTSEQSNGFTCPGGRTVFSSSVIWGAIGPARVYSAGKIYSGLLHFFWIGALMPVVTWVIWKYWKTADGKGRDWLRLINWPLIFVGTYNVPPATGINYSSWALVNVIFNFWIKRRWFAWWCKSLLKWSIFMKFGLTELKPNTTMSLQRLLILDSLSRLLSYSFASLILGGCFRIGGVSTVLPAPVNMHLYTRI